MASTKLYVGNIAHGTTGKELREVFEAFGEIEEVAVKDGFAFVVGYPILYLKGKIVYI